MRKVLISIVFIAGMIITSKGQNNAYGISIGLGNGIILKEALDGGASYDINTGFSIGLLYGRKLSNKLHLMTSVNLYDNSVTVTPNFHPGIDMTPQTYDVRLIYIPVLLKVDLSNYFFINGGLIGDIDITKDKYITNQSGIGATLGIGTEFSINNKFSIQLNPYLNFHGLLLTNMENYPERVFDSGIKLNLIIKR